MKKYKDLHDCIDTDTFLNHTKSDIEKYGLQIIYIPCGYLPSFSYSIGLFESYQHPEIICF